MERRDDRTRTSGRYLHQYRMHTNQDHDRLRAGAHYVRQSAKWGIHTSGMRIDIDEVLTRKNRNVHDWRAGQEDKFRDRAEHIRLYRGYGRFTAPHSVSVNGEDLDSER